MAFSINSYNVPDIPVNIKNYIANIHINYLLRKNRKMMKTISAIIPTTTITPVHIPASKIPSIVEQLLSTNIIIDKIPIILIDKYFGSILKF